MPQPGDFFLLVGTDTIGRLIRVGEWLNGDGWSTYSHAGLLLDDGTILEAEPGGARIRPASEYPTELMRWSSWTLSGAARHSLVLHGRQLVGVPYSFLDYASLALHRFHLRPPGLKSYIASTKHLICSQLVDEVYWRAGLHMFADGRWPGDVTPADLAAVLTGPQVTT
jgi:hypothetical protein